MLASLRVSAEAQVADADVDQGHRFAAPVARLPAVLEHRQVMPQARRLVALFGRTQRHGIGEPALRHRPSERRGPREAGLGDGEPRCRVALECKRLGEPLHRAQRDVLGPRTLRQLQRTSCFAFRARPFAHAVRDVAAPPGRLGPPRVPFGALAARLRRAPAWPRCPAAGRLRRARSSSVRSRVASSRQRKRAVVRRRQHQRSRRAVERLLVGECGCVVGGRARIELGRVRGVAGLRVVLGGGR